MLPCFLIYGRTFFKKMLRLKTDKQDIAMEKRQTNCKSRRRNDGKTGNRHGETIDICESRWKSDGNIGNNDGKAGDRDRETIEFTYIYIYISINK